MSEQYSPDEPEDRNENYEQEAYEYSEHLAECLAVSYKLGILTSDNKSTINNLSGFEQTLRTACFGIVGLTEFTNDVYSKMMEVSDICNGRTEEDYVGVFIRIEEEAEIEYIERYNNYMDEIIQSLAANLCESVVTDDCKSKINGYTQLDQAIIFYMGYMNKDRLNEFKGRVYKKYKEWNTGSFYKGISYSDLKKLPETFS